MKRYDSRVYWFLLVIFMGIFSCLYGALIPELGDIYWHNMAAELLFTDEFYTTDSLPIHILAYPLYHLCVKYLALITRISIDDVSVFVIALSIVVAIMIYRKLFYATTGDKERLISDLVCFGVVIFVCARCGLNGWRYYQSQCAANPIHNPTILFMRPFGLASIFFYHGFIERIYDRNKKGEYKYLLGFSLFMLLSILAKPNFAIVFLPAMGLQTLYIMIRRKDIFYGIKMFLAVVPSLALLVFQQMYVTSKTVAFSSFAIKFGSFSEFTPKEVLFVSLVTFPVPILLFRFKYLKENIIYQLSLVALIVGWFQMFFLTNGPSGDFSWGYDVAVQVATFMSLAVAISDKDKKNYVVKILHWCAYLVFIYQVICGIMYWSQAYSVVGYWF